MKVSDNRVQCTETLFDCLLAIFIDRLVPRTAKKIAHVGRFPRIFRGFLVFFSLVLVRIIVYALASEMIERHRVYLAVYGDWQQRSNIHARRAPSALALDSCVCRMLCGMARDGMSWMQLQSKSYTADKAQHHHQIYEEYRPNTRQIRWDSHSHEGPTMPIEDLLSHAKWKSCRFSVSI